MSKNISWLNWIVAALGGLWGVYLMLTIPSNADVKYILTVGALMIVSAVLLETGVRKL